MQYAVKRIGILFAWMKSCKTPVLGIVRSVVHAETGESGIVKFVINVLMGDPCHAKTAVTPRRRSGPSPLSRLRIWIVKDCGAAASAAIARARARTTINGHPKTKH